MHARDLEQQVLQLQPAERAKLARRLLESLESLSESEIEAAWLDEAERRERALDSGQSKAIPATQVIEEARRSLS